jgi:pimeloyl-ACP methyl ester carboxylesterase
MSKRPSHPVSPHTPVKHEVVDPRWLLKAGAATLLFALFCAWGTLCFLFYQGQWQFALHPSRAVDRTPTALNLPFEAVRFGVDATGTAQLNGWYIPSDSPGTATALILHTGDGSISDALPSAQILHTARLNVLLFDYRGFGTSGGAHPTELLMQADAESALDYLTGTRKIPLQQVLPFGMGVGASLATQLCVHHRELPALLLDSPTGDIDSSVAHDPRTRLIPTRLFLHEHFALAQPLSSLKTPKLVVTYTNGIAPMDVRQAADPKMTVEFHHRDDVAYVQNLNRFLDLYLPHPLPSLTLPRPIPILNLKP